MKDWKEETAAYRARTEKKAAQFELFVSWTGLALCIGGISLMINERYLFGGVAVLVGFGAIVWAAGSECLRDG